MCRLILVWEVDCCDGGFVVIVFLCIGDGGDGRRRRGKCACVVEISVE